jgi:predicted alpha/beta-fold hydrolase
VWLPRCFTGIQFRILGDKLSVVYYHSLFIQPAPRERQLLQLPDGGTISLDVYPPFEGPEDNTPVLFMLHGLTGNTQESYIRATVKEITRSKMQTGVGFRVVALNFRGCKSWIEYLALQSFSSPFVP